MKEFYLIFVEVGEDFGKRKGVEDVGGGEPPFLGDPDTEIGIA